MTDKPIKKQLCYVADVSLSAGEVREMIARRAYDLYKQRGSESGDDLSDWLRAEAEVVTMLLSQPPVGAETRKQNTRPAATLRNGRSAMKTDTGTRPVVRRLPKRKNLLT
jgi:hypothetical protein